MTFDFRSAVWHQVHAYYFLYIYLDYALDKIRLYMNPWYHLCFQVTSIFSIFCVFFTSLKSFEIKYLNFEVIVKGREVVMVSSYNGITNSHFENPELVFLISSRIRSVLFSFSCKFVIFFFICIKCSFSVQKLDFIL